MFKSGQDGDILQGFEQMMWLRSAHKFGEHLAKKKKNWLKRMHLDNEE